MEKDILIIRALARLVALNAHNDKTLLTLHHAIQREFKDELTPAPISMKSRALAQGGSGVGGLSNVGDDGSDVDPNVTPVEPEDVG